MEEEITAVLGGIDVVMEPLTHNPLNAVTGGIWRVRRGSRSAVLKVLTRRKDAPDGWRHSEDPRHWNYWRREADVYADGLPRLWAGSGLRDSVFDLFLPAALLPALDAAVYGAYVRGLRESGWADEARRLADAVL
ncbi:hypothetical protein SAMN05444920_110317 [Nonomuraea solani]|uniref:Uncharacterized protein n=1 Tax=Nonomuraea solani TaxID=1144553 RepID=A0A1H6EHM4_9ACTN|nr:hypothetical protein [Nonomuraea solani]SEG97320.1 hypothetical protein SAMN05444920_110317 [Nonomuraea solani]